MSSHTSQRVSPAFRRAVALSLLFVLLMATASFVWVGRSLLGRAASRSALARARFVAASLEPGRGGDLAESAARLRARCPDLLAVGVLDSSGRLAELHSDRPGCREAALSALSGGARTTATHVLRGRRRAAAWAVVLPLGGDSSSTATRVLVLLAGEPRWTALASASVLFGLLTAVAVLVAFAILVRWFEARVASPLGTFAQSFSDPAGVALRPPEFRTGGWVEMERIAEQFTSLLGNLRKHDARAKRIEWSAKEEIERSKAKLGRQLRRAKDEATIDSLTGLRNRSFLSDEFEPLLTRQRAAEEDLAVVMLDVDDFKRVNDRFGHEAGDHVLRTIGDLLQATCRPTDHAIRYGGDEFVLLLPGASRRSAQTVIERFMKLFAQQANTRRSARGLSMSAGVASLGDHPGATADKLLAHADRALYAAKARGKNAVSCD